MGLASLTGKDTTQINGRVLNAFGDGDCTVLNFPNEIVKMKIGKNGNTIYALDNTGLECDVEVRILRGSADDKFLQGLLDAYKRDPASFLLMTGQFVKRVGDGKGNISRDVYTMSGGIITKFVESKDNAEGDTEQAISKYSMKFSNANRGLM